ncbi:MAG: PAS domain-containing protein [Tannerellaceae bacterium]|jgi:nitrogen fixation/metabolism regulation signal transduction histidine kinase|nr:PAS domain-containing protein [Tannerellaceae bacterium]
MRVRGLFWVLTALLLIILAVNTYYAFRSTSFYLFLAIEALVFFTAIYLVAFYQRIIKPLQIIGDGMELLKEQDFSSRLRKVGQSEADRIVEVFNKMMDRLKEERLHVREQNHFLDLLINASPLGVLILDLDSRILSVNQAALRMLGLKSAGEAVGKHLREVHSPLAAELLPLEPYHSETIRLTDANVYKCTHSSFLDKGFQHSFYLIESLTEEVFKAEKKAYEKVIRMIAHEVNNTTAGITSTLDTLENTFREMAQAEDICEVLKVSIERCYRMNRFITNFADVVRIPEPQLREQELNALVVSCKRFMETICRNRRIQIILELSESSPLVKVDNLLFEQVLVNIIKNSAESIEQDGRIYIRTSLRPACLEIADTGKGISKETETKLFSPFFSTKPNGQGLGLIFIREVLQKHACTFSLNTSADGLTRFRILF